MSYNGICRTPSWKGGVTATERCRQNIAYQSQSSADQTQDSLWNHKKESLPGRASGSCKADVTATLQANQREIQRLNLILEQKNLTMHAIELRDKGLVELSIQIDRLEVELKRSDNLARLLTRFCKNVSKRLDAILNISVLTQIKVQSQSSANEESGYTPNTSSSENDQEVAKVEGLNLRQIEGKLDIVEAKLRKLSALQPSSLTSIGVSQDTRQAAGFDSSRLRKLQKENQQLEAILKVSEQTKLQLAHSMESDYQMIKKRLAQKKSYSGAATEDDIIVLMSRMSRLEKQLQSEATNSLILQRDYAEQLKKLYNGVKETEKRHREELQLKDRQILTLRKKHPSA